MSLACIVFSEQTNVQSWTIFIKHYEIKIHQGVNLETHFLIRRCFHELESILLIKSILFLKFQKSLLKILLHEQKIAKIAKYLQMRNARIVFSIKMFNALCKGQRLSPIRGLGLFTCMMKTERKRVANQILQFLFLSDQGWTMGLESQEILSPFGHRSLERLKLNKYLFDSPELVVSFHVHPWIRSLRKL